MAIIKLNPTGRRSPTPAGTNKPTVLKPVNKPPAATVTPTEDINAKALRVARENATKEAMRVEECYRLRSIRKINTWQDLARVSGVEIPGVFTILPFDYLHVSAFVRHWQSSFETRHLAALEHTRITAAALEAANTLPADAPSGTPLGELTLKPEQSDAATRILATLNGGKIRRVLQDGKGGSGKTYIAAGVIVEWFRSGRWKQNPILDALPYRVIVLTRKTVREQYTRVLRQAGLGEYLASHQLLVTSYSQLSAGFAERFMTERFDHVRQTSTTDANPMFAPTLVICDECHALNDPDTKQTKFILAWQKLGIPMLFMSATPFITVNHARTFIVNSGLRDDSVGLITTDNWKIFAGTLCKRPDKPNKAAAKRLRDKLLAAGMIVSLAKVKWDHKAINQILIVDFADDAAMIRYNRAYHEYREAKRRIGKSPAEGPLEHLVALGQFAKAAEPLRAPALLKLSEKYLAAGFAPVIGCEYRETVAQLVDGFVHKLGIPRDKISVIWGGKRRWKVEDMLSDDEIADVSARILGDPDSVEDWELRAFTETLNYKTEAAMLGETPEEQTARLARLRDLGLEGAQSAAERQSEIDKFQSGQSVVCIFTLAAGGVGLSLDQDKPTLRPRVGFFTPCYSGPKFQQALFRLIRRCTLSDVHQFMVYLRGTVEETHIAPKVDRNLKCIAAITGAAFSLLDFETAVKHEATKFRTVEEAMADAEAVGNRVEDIDLMEDEDDED